MLPASVRRLFGDSRVRSIGHLSAPRPRAKLVIGQDLLGGIWPTDSMVPELPPPLLLFLCLPGAPDRHVIHSAEHKWNAAGWRHVLCRVRVSLIGRIPAYWFVQLFWRAGDADILLSSSIFQRSQIIQSYGGRCE
jgi:hypothetical protein